MENCNRNSVLLTVPCLTEQGGVASYYNGVLPHFPESINHIEVGGAGRSGGLLHPFVDQFRFRKAVKKNNPALVHINPSLSFKCLVRDGLFAWQAHQMNVPLLVFWHGWDKDFETVVERKYQGFFHRTFGRARAHIVLASEFQQKLQDWGVTAPIYRETTCVDDNLVTGFDVQEKWSESAQKTDTVKILFLARLERAKGVFETVQAMRLLVEKKLPVSLTIAGDGEIRRELEEYARSLGFTAEQVCFTGDIRGKEKIRAFTQHHIYCFPTFYGEGLPTSVLEAMAFGMPVVTRPVGGLADIFEHGRMGRLVQGKSPDEIAGCLENILTNPDRMAAMARYNAEYAREHFMASRVAKRLQGIYTEI